MFTSRPMIQDPRCQANRRREVSPHLGMQLLADLISSRDASNFPTCSCDQIRHSDPIPLWTGVCEEHHLRSS